MGDEFRPTTWSGSGGKKSVQATGTTRSSSKTKAAAEPPVPEIANPDPEPEAEPDATEAARTLASEADIDLGDVEGTGTEGRITRDDVAAHVTDT